MKFQWFNIRLVKWLFIVFFVGVSIFITALLATAKVTKTPSGSYYKLYLFNIISMHLSYSGAAEKARFIDYPFAAPIIEEMEDQGSYTVHWYCFDRPFKQTITGQKVNLNCKGQSHSFEWSNEQSPVVVEQDTVAEKILVLSDIHGDIAYLNSVLSQMSVVDEKGQWSWSDNQVVVTGDSIAKGPADFSVLWRLYQLSKQAEEAGGSVHVLIGNHENFQLLGNHSRLNPDMRVKSFAMLENTRLSQVPYEQHTVLGRWLRSRPVVIRLGDYLFAHGGLSKHHLHSNYSLKQLNQAVWQYYQSATDQEIADKQALELTLGNEGLIWYRGQLRSNPDAKPDAQELTQILRHYGAKKLVIGHSPVATIEALYDGQVWPAHAEHQSGQVLLIEQGQARMHEVETQWYDFEHNYRVARQSIRPLRIFNNNDGESELSVIYKMYSGIKGLHRRTKEHQYQ